MKKLLLASVAALSLLSATSAHADELGDALKPFWEWLRWIDTNWLGSVWHGGGATPERSWNGRWPKHTVVLEYEGGGVAHEHRNRWINLAASGSDVEIRGPCFSAPENR